MQAAEQRGLMAFGQGWNMATFAPKAQLTAIENHWGDLLRPAHRRDARRQVGDEQHLVGPQGGHPPDEPLRPAGDARGGAPPPTPPPAAIKDGSAPAFAGPIKDRDGTERVAAGATLDDAGLWKMDWYVEGVQG